MRPCAPTHLQRLKAALWYSIGQIVDDETLKHSCGSINATPQFIGALMELVWAQIETASKDLESFAKCVHNPQALPGPLEISQAYLSVRLLEDRLADQRRDLRIGAQARRAFDDPGPGRDVVGEEE